MTKPLTPQGRRILELSERGLHERAIARRVGVTVHMVRMHLAAAAARAGRRETG